jgi:hypothetical protein
MAEEKSIKRCTGKGGYITHAGDGTARVKSGVFTLFGKISGHDICTEGESKAQ